MLNWLFIIGFVTVLAIILALGLNFFLKFQQNRYRKKQKYIVLTVRVSKENETGPIVAEQIFSTIHSINYKLSILDRLKGCTAEQISFEIANVDNSIRFYIWTPEKLKNLIEGQIYAQYPDVEIFELPDYTQEPEVEISTTDLPEEKSKEKNLIKHKTKRHKLGAFDKISEYAHSVGAELAFRDPDVYPIKRYPQFEDKLTRVAVDPIGGITASLAKLNHSHDQAWIQVVVRPLEDKWRILFIKCLRLLNKNLFGNIEKLQKIYARMYCTRRKVYRIIFFPLYFFFWIQGLTAGMKKLKVSMTGDTSRATEEDELRDEMSMRHDRETSLGAAQDKVSRLLYEATIRLIYIPEEKNLEKAKVKIREIAGSFAQFNIPHLNSFTIHKIKEGHTMIQDFQDRALKHSMVLNNEELGTVYHMPNMTVQTPHIYWVRSKKLEPPRELPLSENLAPEELTILGKTNFRGIHRDFGIETLDRRRHLYIIGKTGMGKSTLLENMIFSDIQGNRGIAVVDPHGDLADNMLDFVPSHRTNQVVIFDPSDRDHPVAFNMLENIDPSQNSIVCSGIVGIFKKIYGESWGPRLEHFLRNTILALLEYPNTTLLGITRMLQDEDFRHRVMKKITDPIVKAFWENEFEKMHDRQRTEAISPILNKVGQFLSSPIIRNIVGQPKSAVDLRFAMDKGKIVVVNLSKGKIGEDNSSLLGAMIITKFQLDAMSRANVPEKERKDFYLYVDEFQNFATDSFATILSEARKYRLNLTMANQYIAQMPEEVRDAVFGNVGSTISFQVGFDDAEYLSQQFAEEATPNDLVSLSKYTAYIRLLIDGIPSCTFSFDTFPPPEFDTTGGRRDKVVSLSRERYSKPRELVEDKIRRWSESTKQLDSGDRNQGGKFHKGPPHKSGPPRSFERHNNRNENPPNKPRKFDKPSEKPSAPSSNPNPPLNPKPPKNPNS